MKTFKEILKESTKEYSTLKEGIINKENPWAIRLINDPIKGQVLFDGGFKTEKEAEKAMKKWKKEYPDFEFDIAKIK